MIHVRDVRAKIAAVLRNEISVEDFARWIMANSWNMHKDSSKVAVDLVSSVHLLLAERSDRECSPSELRRELETLLSDAPPVQLSYSMNSTIPVSLYINIEPSQVAWEHRVITGAAQAQHRFVPVPELA